MAPILIALTAAPLWAQEKLSLRDISRALNDLDTVKGAFTQINSDGSFDKGTIYIKRPGRARFEYEGKNAPLVMVGGGQVAIFDQKSNQGPEQYPLKRTPLNLILKRNVNLRAENMVVGHDFDGTTTSVTAQDPENPELGNIRLVFSGPPVELRQWVITNQDGSQTTVILGDTELGGSLPPALFSIPTEINKRSN
ncbi:Outer membrane lipoprotein carrier protein LolA [Candidatus Rhodobacter oscarellae]|uniref:Outer membrane lipoprotein carrier protein LolA n=1 Tax=Candidatus Rhodobacter oscarellae TaxID=1675527 RepID=A0A0J9E762_9RHOB|nr:Outer membrane lipoprotein carrier protein LolA [Candidatus Rhodobacter lobularis]